MSLVTPDDLMEINPNISSKYAQDVSKTITQMMSLAQKYDPIDSSNKLYRRSDENSGFVAYDSVRNYGPVFSIQTNPKDLHLLRFHRKIVHDNVEEHDDLWNQFNQTLFKSHQSSLYARQEEDSLALPSDSKKGFLHSVIKTVENVFHAVGRLLRYIGVSFLVCFICLF